MHTAEKYFITGFYMLVSPGHVADAEIWFRTMGHSPSISGVDLYDKSKKYLGFVYPQNIDLEVKRAMLKYIRTNPKKWQRVRSSDDIQNLRSR